MRSPTPPAILLLSILALGATAGQAIPLPARLAALGLDRWSALHDEIDKGAAGDVADQAEGAPCSGGRVVSFACRNVDLLAFLPLADIGGGSGNDVWGWTDPKSGREFVLMGRSSGTAIVEVTDPAEPVYLGDLPTRTRNTPWRDIKVHAHHAYVVADSAGRHGLQVLDLRQLRRLDAGPVVFEESAHYDEFGSAHNIAINEETGFAYVVGSDTCAGGLHMIDLAQPKAPRFAGCFVDDSYTHDVQCVLFRGDDARYFERELCFAANEDTLTVVDVTDKADPVLVSRTGYTETGYTHQGWLTDDHRYFLLDDELDEADFALGTRTLVWDLADLERPVLAGEHVSTNPSIDHNQYVRGRHTYQANYRSGLRILELENLAEGRLREVAFFDTYPEDDRAAFDGAWGVYPFLASGAVAVSDINRGLFLLRPRLDEQLFADGFESGDLSLWARRRGGAIAIVEPGLGGSEFALAVSVAGGSRSYVASTFSGRQTSLVVDLLLSANRVGLADGVEIARLLDRKRVVASLHLERQAQRYEVELRARSGKRMVPIGRARVPAAGETKISVEWRRASSKRAGDGLASLWKDGKLEAQNHQLANGRFAVGELRLGRPGSPAASGASGVVVLDEVVARP